MPELILNLVLGRHTLKLVTLALAATIAFALSAGVAMAQPIHHHHHHHIVRHHHHVVRHHRVIYRHHHHHTY